MPKYKSKIERKIDALLTITDTLCTHIYPRATSITLPLPMLFNVLFCFYCYRSTIRFFLLLERKCPEKRNLVFWCVRNRFPWLIHTNAFVQTTCTDTLQVLCDPVKTVQHRNTVVVRVWGCSYMYSCELENGKRVTYGGWKLMLLSAESFVEKRFGSFLIFPSLWDVSWLAELWLFRS